MFDKNIILKFFLVFTFFFSIPEYVYGSIKIYTLELNTDLIKEKNYKKNIIKNDILLEIAQNETRPFCFVLESDNNIQDLTVDFEIDEIINANTDNIKAELFYLKYWYQSGAHTVYNRGVSNYVAELLVKDYSLVNVDYENKKNYLKITNEFGAEQYVDISTKDILFNQNWIINDKVSLLPYSLPKNTEINLFSDIRVGENVESGLYKANFVVSSGKKIIQKVPILINVLDMKLDDPALSTAIYYRAKLNTGYIRGVGSEEKSPRQYELEMKDLIDHGVQFPTIHQRFITLNLELFIRKKLNFDTQYIYYLDGTGKPKTKSDYKSLAERVKRIVKISKHYGYGGIHIHGIDEARGDLLASERRAFEVVQSSGGKVFKACYDDALRSPRK
jgi:hypothetical protein